MAPGLKFAERDIDDEENVAKPALIHVILLNRTLRILIVMFISVCVIPPLIYHFFYAQKIFALQENRVLGTCGHQPIYHVPCGQENVTAEVCRSFGCCYVPPYNCYHSLPSRQLYSTNDSWTRNSSLYPMQKNTPFLALATERLILDVQPMTKSHLKIEIWNPDKLTKESQSNEPLADYDYKFVVYSRSVVEVNRTSNLDTILTTARGPLISSNNYFEWNIFLGTTFLFGLDGNFLIPGYKTILLNRDNYNSLPFIMAFSKYFVFFFFFDYTYETNT